MDYEQKITLSTLDKSPILSRLNSHITRGHYIGSTTP
jgi:hypothetical protein